MPHVFTFTHGRVVACTPVNRKKLYQYYDNFGVEWGWLSISGNICAIMDTDYSSGDQVITIIDVSNPASPSLLSQITDSVPTIGVGNIVVSGNYVYALGNPARIYSISDPAAPTLAGTIAAGEYGGEQQGWVFTSGGNTYWAFMKNPGGYDHLHIWDVTDPSSPTDVGNVEVPASSQDFSAFYYPYYYSMSANGTPNTGIDIVDCTNPAAPTVVGNIQNPDGVAGQFYGPIVAIEDYVFIADANVPKLYVFDVSDPTTPVLAWSGDIDDEDAAVTPMGIAVDGTNLYIMNLPGTSENISVIVKDASDLTDLIQTGRGSSSGSGDSPYPYFYGLAAKTGYVFFKSGDYDTASKAYLDIW